MRHQRLLTLLIMCLVPLGAAPLDPAPEGTFSIVVIPDTQWYLGRGTGLQPDSTDPVTNPVFMHHVSWIAEHLEDQRIVFVSQVGDIVDKNTPAQWEVARQAMDQLHGKVPYGISPGNHDMTSKGDTSLFQRYFPAARFTSFGWYGGTLEPVDETQAWFGDNANSYQLFEAAGERFVIVHLECNAPDPVVAWANSMLDRYADRHGLLTTHMDLGPIERPATSAGYATDPKGRMRWTKCHGAAGNNGEQLWDKLYRKHANLEFIFCGDQRRSTALRLSAVGDAGNTVWSLLSDYTSSGPLRIYRFLPGQQRVEAITYDTTKLERVESTGYVPELTEHQFSLPWPGAAER